VVVWDVKLNIQIDHVHVLLKVPPKRSISELMGYLKGKRAIQIFRQFPDLKKKTILGKSFLGKGLLC
jgi:putative transposase